MSKGSRRRPEARPEAYAEAYERIFGPTRVEGTLTRESHEQTYGAQQRADADADSEADA